MVVQGWPATWASPIDLRSGFRSTRLCRLRLGIGIAGRVGASRSSVDFGPTVVSGWRRFPLAGVRFPTRPDQMGFGIQVNVTRIRARLGSSCDGSSIPLERLDGAVKWPVLQRLSPGSHHADQASMASCCPPASDPLLQVRAAGAVAALHRARPNAPPSGASSRLINVGRRWQSKCCANSWRGCIGQGERSSVCGGDVAGE